MSFSRYSGNERWLLDDVVQPPRINVHSPAARHSKVIALLTVRGECLQRPARHRWALPGFIWGSTILRVGLPRHGSSRRCRGTTGTVHAAHSSWSGHAAHVSGVRLCVGKGCQRHKRRCQNDASHLCLPWLRAHCPRMTAAHHRCYVPAVARVSASQRWRRDVPMTSALIPFTRVKSV